MDVLVDVPSEAIALANPPLQLNPSPGSEPLPNLYKGVTIMSYYMNIRGKDGRYDHGWCMFGYKLDPTRYDSGFRLIVEYSRNKELPDCAENRILNFGDAIMNHEFFFHQVLPLIHLSAPIMRLVFQTVDGCATVSSIQPCEIIYSPLPSNVDLPVIPISSVTCHKYLTYSVVDLVEFDGELYAFKYDGQDTHFLDILPETRDILGQSKGQALDKEIVHLSHFDSRFIVKPAFLVSDTTDPQRFRGYLMPYHRAGSLSEVLSRLRKATLGDSWVSPRITSQPPSPSYSPDLSPVELEDNEGIDTESFATLTRPCKLLDWATKHLWASDIARGLVVLHEANSFSGDIKLENVVLRADGRLCLIDVNPVSSGCTDCYAPPEVNINKGEPTASHDVFSLGLTLWALAEEMENFSRHHFHVPRLFWQEGEGATPNWYRDLICDCIQLDAEKRPSARSVLETLARGRVDV